MSNGMSNPTAITLSVFALALAVAACSEPGSSTRIPGGRPPGYQVVSPGTHPGLLFSAQELPRLQKRREGNTLAAAAFQKLVLTARGEAAGDERSEKLTAMSLVFQISRDEPLGREAVGLMRELLAEIDPFEYHEKIASDFFATDRWPIAFAYAWDWLYEIMTEQERREILSGIESWCKALFEHTESWWWQEASYNCGAIPVGALGLACTAIQGETTHPEFQGWLQSSIRRIQRNYFPTSWRSSGICWEGPCYAIVGYENPAQFGEALRRTGGPDILRESGAVNAMAYQIFQWMPQEGCGPIGDNTDYGRRVFAAEYLLGLGELSDRAGWWTFQKYTDRERLDPVITFLWYPESLEPVSPATLGLPTSRYFEITRNRAGYVYSRSEWDHEAAAYFAFTTRFEEANHQHYDMNSFLFSAFGEEFATHRNIFPYNHEHHGADLEHNIVVIDEGGMPAKDRSNSAGDDASIKGLLTGLGLGHFADYVRGDARWSYQDSTDPTTLPALRADRSCLFVKQGPNPYLVVIDDIQKSGREHDYFWQWYAPVLTSEGAGSLVDPLVVRGRKADCAIFFLSPEEPESSFSVVNGGRPNRPIEIGRIRVRRRGTRVRFVAVAAAWPKGSRPPEVSAGPTVAGNSSAVSIRVDGDGFSDLIVWQPEEHVEGVGLEIQAGELVTDGLMALLRRDAAGRVQGYALGDGTRLTVEGQVLAEGELPFSVSADDVRIFTSGQRRARADLPPLQAAGKVRVLGGQTEIFHNGEAVRVVPGSNGMADLRAVASPPSD